MLLRRWEIGLFLSLGVMLGLGVAVWRDAFRGSALFAQTAVGEGGARPDTATVAPVPTKPEFKGKIGRTIDESTPYWPQPVVAPKGAPNVLFIVLDDVGFGQMSCFGGGVRTPHLDKLAKNGLRYANFHTTALCSPSRSCFLTGRNHHSNAMACITEGATGFPGSNGHIPLSNGFLSQMLSPFGWISFAIGKWHLTPLEEMNLGAPRTQWPLQRGFDRFYGFLGAETNNWYPELTHDSHFIKPPKTPEQGYHLTVDLTDKAIENLTDLRNVDTEKPWFTYFCPGAAHAPHHSPKEWADKYKGEFDKGWDVYREETYRRQLDMGIIPPGTKLPARDPDVPEWSKLSGDEKKVYGRMMEVFAGFLSHADDNIGRLLEHLRKSGEIDNTIIFVVSDNGASAEGGVTGSINENLFMNMIPDDIKTNLKFLDDLGGVKTYNHYAWGWTWAGNTPFRRWKREVHRGGCTDPLIVHWPKGIKAKGEIRHQFVHAIDLVPTILDVVGVKPPAVLNGVAQSPIEGASFRHTFDDPKAPSKRNTQYYEMFAYRAIYHDGWRAVAPWPLGKEVRRGPARCGSVGAIPRRDGRFRIERSREVQSRKAPRDEGPLVGRGGQVQRPAGRRPRPDALPRCASRAQAAQRVRLPPERRGGAELVGGQSGQSVVQRHGGGDCSREGGRGGAPLAGRPIRRLQPLRQGPEAPVLLQPVRDRREDPLLEHRDSERKGHAPRRVQEEGD